MIEVPAAEKIIGTATGDKEFWVVDVVGNFCFVHPAKPGIASNLNLITYKGNIYSFTLAFKLEAVRLVESGQSIAEASRSLGVVEQTLAN